MSFKISEFNPLEFLEKFLGESTAQNKLPSSQSFAADNTATQTDFGFQEKSLLGGNAFQARFTAAQNTQRASSLTATSPASQLVRDPRVHAMLDVLGFTEGTGNNYGKVVNGTVLSAPGHPELVGRRNISVDDFTHHPNILVQVRPGLNSTAAGRYQFLGSTWRGLGMPDFSPQSQDIAAVKLMQQRGMIEPLLRGDVRTAIFRGAPEWASLPKNAQNQGYYSGQSARTLNDILGVYNSSLHRYQGQGTAPTAPAQPTRPTTPNAPATNGTLSRGEHNNQVKDLQTELVKLGHLTQAQMNTGPGIFGQRTENAVKDFQRDNHLPVTGKWDAASKAALDKIFGVVKRGDHGSVVRGVQEQLVKAGFMTRAQMNTGPGIFGRRTEAALKKFQAAHHLVPDGKLGPLTYRALQNASATRPQQPAQPTHPTHPTQPAQPTAPVNGKTYSYQPWATYSSGAGGVRHVNNYDQLLPHHDYQHVTRGGQRLEVRDVVLTRPGQNNNGQTLPSPLEGRVVNIRHQGSKGYGNSIEVVNDRTGERFLVGHLSRVDVHVGQHVAYGQPIGAQGSTGHSTGPHVHIESESHVIRRWVNDLVDGKFDGK